MRIALVLSSLFALLVLAAPAPSRAEPVRYLLPTPGVV